MGLSAEMLNVDLNKIDRHLTFLRDQAMHLRKTQGHAQWALSKANQFDEIADFLVEVRRSKQMTGIGGKRLTDNGSEQ